MILLGLILLVAGCRSGSWPIVDSVGHRCADCNVVLISIDTLRADHLGCYGYIRPTSPVIDRFAEKSSLFTNLINTGGGTLSVHMSMMTSLPPTVHDVWSAHPTRLDEARITLAEELRSHGYSTAAFTDGGWMRGKFGFDQGFDSYDEKGGHFGKILPKAYTWLRRHRSEKFFLFLHTYDVHSAYRALPYDPPPPYRDLYTDGYSGRFWGCMRGACASHLLGTLNAEFAAGRRNPKQVFTDEDLTYVVALYDGGITHVDHQIGEFLHRLRALDLEGRTIVVITSDHGEEFLEHGLLLHDQNYEEIAHVPLLVRLPGDGVKPRAIPTLVSTLDLMPTILDVLGFTPNPEVRGRSLFPLMLGGEKEGTPVLVEGGKEKIRDRRWSLFVAGDYPLELYDLTSDPGERANVLPLFPVVAEDLLATFVGVRQAELDLKRSFAAAPRPETEITTEEREQLKALGYVN